VALDVCPILGARSRRAAAFEGPEKNGSLRFAKCGMRRALTLKLGLTSSFHRNYIGF
jgi:hypothetical protein